MQASLVGLEGLEPLLFNPALADWARIPPVEGWPRPLIRFIDEATATGLPLHRGAALGFAVHRAIWILDRIAPGEPAERFAAWLGSGAPRRLTVFAWAKRVVADADRLRPPGIALDPPIYDALIAAHCAAYERRPPEGLLDFWRLGRECAPAGAPSLHSYYGADRLIVDAYAERTTDRDLRRQRLLDLAFEAPLLAPFAARAQALRWLLVEAAREAGPPDVTEHPDAWVDAELTASGRPELVAALHEITGRRGYLDLGVQYWAERHDATSWEAVADAAMNGSEVGRPVILRRLVGIVPPDRFDVWFRSGSSASGLAPIVSFARWLRPEFRDLLLAHARRHQDLDWAACAWHAYMKKSPPAILRALERSPYANELTAWQRTALARFLHAPTPVRAPGDVVEDVQTVEADERLVDLLNHRAL